MCEDALVWGEAMAMFEFCGEVRVEIGYLGEGWNGDYDEDDPDDTPLLRFDAHDLKEYDRAWESRSWSDASYCTQIPADTPIEYLELFCFTVAEALCGEESWKRKCEDFSWATRNELEEMYVQCDGHWGGA